MAKAVAWHALLDVQAIFEAHPLLAFVLWVVSMEQLSNISSSGPHDVIYASSQICYLPWPVITDLFANNNFDICWKWQDTTSQQNLSRSLAIALQSLVQTEPLRSIPRPIICQRQKYVTESYKGRWSYINPTKMNPTKRRILAPKRNTKLKQFQVIRLSEWHHCHNELPKHGDSL